jgi:hypothetical protein
VRGQEREIQRKREITKYEAHLFCLAIALFASVFFLLLLGFVAILPFVNESGVVLSNVEELPGYKGNNEMVREGEESSHLAMFYLF